VKKLAWKRLALSRETLLTLNSKEAGNVLGAYPTVASACKAAGCGTDDPDLCVASWASNCYTYTCH